MTIASTTRKAGPTPGNGITTAFPFTFKVFANTDLLVVQTSPSGVESTQVLTSQYTVSLNANQDANPGGTVNMIVAPPTGYTLTIGSQIPYSQGATVTNSGGFYPTVINDIADRVTALIQQVLESVGRTLKLPFSVSSSVSATLPSPVADGIFKWNSAANAIESVTLSGVVPGTVPVSTYAATLLDDVDASNARTTLGAMAGNALNSIVSGRLTLVSGSPVPAADQTAKTTVYFTPYGGNRIALHDGSNWGLVTFAEKSVAVPNVANTPFDIFAYTSAGTIALETVNWSSATARATAIVLQDGVYVKSGDTTRRYLGTGLTTPVAGQCEDSAAKRYLWNYYNRVQRSLRKAEATLTWTYGTNTWRRVNGNGSDNIVEFVIGVAEDALSFQAQSVASNSTATVRGVYTGIGIDSDTVPSGTQGYAATTNTVSGQMTARHEHAYVAIGYHYVAALEIGAGSDTQTFSGNSTYQSIIGSMRG